MSNKKADKLFIFWSFWVIMVANKRVLNHPNKMLIQFFGFSDTQINLLMLYKMGRIDV